MMHTMTNNRDAQREAATEARRIASEWHGGQASPLYALSSSGAIVDGCLAEITRGTNALRSLVEDPSWAAGRDDLIWLRLYVTLHGERGPVEGWSDLRF